MDARQGDPENPFGMDESCERCPNLCESRSQVVHGYGDVGADFLVLGEAPDAGADASGIPFTGEDRLVLEVLARVGLVADPAAERPDVDGVYLSYLARCHHPERPPTDAEVDNCEPYRSSELRMINPEVIVPVGQRALEALAFEYTTEQAADLDIAASHGTTLRGRGFELLPLREPANQTAAETEAFVERFAELLGSDYRQTKGRQGSLESGRGPDSE
jgi:uracil-DNA glycosylase family 4